MESLKFSNDGNKDVAEQPKKKKSPVKIIIAILIACVIFAGVGSFAYLSAVKDGGKVITEAAFEYGRDFDTTKKFSETLPERYQGIVDMMIDDDVEESMNLKTNVKKYVTDYVAENGLSSIITEEVIDKCVDLVLKDVAQNASYEVTDVNAGFTSCTVTVHTSNVDYAKLIQQVINAVESDITNTNSKLWQDAGNVLGSILQSLFSDSKENSNVDISDLIASTITEYYQNQKAQAEMKEATGQVVYGISDGKWTVISVDKELVNSFYGIDFESLGFDLNTIANGAVTFK